MPFPPLFPPLCLPSSSNDDVWYLWIISGTQVVLLRAALAGYVFVGSTKWTKFTIRVHCFWEPAIRISSFSLDVYWGCNSANWILNSKWDWGQKNYFLCESWRTIIITYIMRHCIKFHDYIMVKFVIDQWRSIQKSWGICLFIYNTNWRNYWLLIHHCSRWARSFHLFF